MSDEKQETLADIVAEIRLRGRTVADTEGAALWTSNAYFSLADRIKKAAKRLEADALNCGAIVEATRKPRRNCDRFKTADEALNGYYKKIRNNEVRFMDWLFMPAK